MQAARLQPSRNSDYIPSFQVKEWRAALLLFLLSLVFAPGRVRGDVELRFLPTEGVQGENASYPVKFVINELPAGTALQFDIQWNPNLISTVDPSLSSDADTHLIDSSNIGDNQTRVLVYSLTNSDIEIEGLLTLEGVLGETVTTEYQPFSISNVLLSDANSDSVTVASATLKFNIPKNVNGLFSLDKTHVSLLWDINDAPAFEVYRATSDDFVSASLLGSPADPSFQDDTVEKTRYHYWVAARYEDGLSTIGSSIEIGPVPHAPGNFAVVNVTHPDDLSLSWVVTDEDTASLQVLRSIGSSLEGAELIAELQPNQLNLVDDGTVSGIPYFYWVRGINEFGTGPATTAEQGLAQISEVFEETQLTAETGGGTFALNWQTISGNSYRIAYSHDLKTWNLLPDSAIADGSPLQWDLLEELEIDFPAYFQVFSVSE